MYMCYVFGLMYFGIPQITRYMYSFLLLCAILSTINSGESEYVGRGEMLLLQLKKKKKKNSGESTSVR